ncbi:hypothetical protein HKX48_005385 [Thoreauomyces humboldtii]|nr:hypothetical protein HKX48_005385 [Thoreauomyces humboldtii]
MGVRLCEAVRQEADIDKYNLREHILDGLSHIRPTHVAGWLREVQRNYILALQREKLGYFYHNSSILRLAQFWNGGPGDDSDSGEDSAGDDSAGDDAPVEEEEEGADDDEDDSA